MVQFDWPATLIGSSTALLGICLGFSAVRAWLRRLWDSLCDRGTPDVEQAPDNHSTELDDLARAILPDPALLFDNIPPLPSLPLESIGPPWCPPPPPPPPSRLRTARPRPLPPLPPLRAADRPELVVHLSTMVVRVVPHS
ncbi:hypothetical protein NUH16_010428 [Penicillium rubens]|uniref:uncharacterized protein n=1 Tax=Penicillium rubens TaxID=1108849 RepID=UPI002A5B039F|nr:uncharacterized protein N7525_009536 [Penicillium rubens]KAJ5053358.1 hypothetical protein NUH16_010428 [Penicillium rubens]KAJ5831283.1 hypothetical protein N7525_009536 [Penicillium rubens]KAJ5854826.1 hypothetical protein N7534_007369 [Penicillium rubens]